MSTPYERYLQLPLATSNPSDTPSELYRKGWVVKTGRSMAYPHPHRYFTPEEFNERVNLDKEFMERFCIAEPKEQSGLMLLEERVKALEEVLVRAGLASIIITADPNDPPYRIEFNAPPPNDGIVEPYKLDTKPRP